MFTVITKGNNVRQYPDSDVNVYRDIKNNVYDYMIVHNDGLVASNQGNPITWPTAATDGMQAIVDVKAGTLRFAYDGWSRAATEFVVSTYGDSGTVSAPHIFDIINYWPQQDRQCLGTKDLPEGWMWQWAGNDWVLSNGTIGLVRDDWFKYRNKMVEDSAPAHVLDLIKEWPTDGTRPAHVLDLIKEWPTDGTRPAVLVSPPGFSWRHHDGGVWSLCGMNGDSEFFEGHWLNYHENKKKYAKPFVSLEDGDLSTPVQPKAPVTKEDVMKLIDIWPHDDNIPVNRDVTDNWIWSRKCHKNVIINLVDNVNSGVVITENDWRNYLSEELRKYPPIIGTNHDPVNRPSHYTAGGIECIDAIKASMSTEAFLGFLKGNVQKYMWRYEKKVATVEDLKKAQWYLSKLIEEQERS
jgi:hypothetical protein